MEKYLIIELRNKLIDMNYGEDQTEIQEDLTNNIIDKLQELINIL